MANKYTCRCGKRVEVLTSYFNNGVRITVCDECAMSSGLKWNEEFKAVNYEEIKEDKTKYYLDGSGKTI